MNVFFLVNHFFVHRDAATKDVAKEKVAHVIEKLGYPDWANNEVTAENMLDYTYKDMVMSDTDNFANVQQMRNHKRLELCDIRTFGRDPFADWRKTPLYSVRSTYFYPWNEMVIPAGLLQFPLFSGSNPEMYRMTTFGSVGFRMARGYLYGISENGQYFDKYGNQLDQSWWSKETSDNFNAQKQCLTNWYSTVKTEPLVYGGQKQQLHLTNPSAYASQAAIDIGALRNAFIAYTSDAVQSQEKTSHEAFLPGIPAKTKNEYFFLSFAQVSFKIIFFSCFLN